MKALKKVFAGLLMLCMLVAVLPMGNTEASAATKIKSGKWVTSTTNSDKFVDYTYVVEAPGYFTFSLKNAGKVAKKNGVAQKKADYKIFASLVANDKTYIEKDVITWSDSYESPKFCFEKGTKVTIRVFDGKGCKSPFKLKVNYTKSTKFEVENNNAMGNSNTIKKRVTYTGIAGKADEDWFTISASKTGRYRVKAACAMKGEESVRVDVFVGNVLKYSTTVKAGESWKDIYTANLLKDEKLYIKVYEGDNGTTYKFNVK
ncbi:MAG: hypothetical protein MJ131_09960 [Lachnospiraceae bacterium]|nr:hypothetical protein [Lachnospiraceae bacterium]